MKTALAAALLVLSVTGASAQPDRVAWGGMAADVVKAVAQKRALVRKSHPRRHHSHRPKYRTHESRTRVAGRPAAWCGWWLGHHLGMLDRRLWLARNWASVGSNAGGPRVGAIVVWRHHVGIITGRTASGWVVKSGNDGHAVRERVRSLSGAIAYRVRA